MVILFAFTHYNGLLHELKPLQNLIYFNIVTLHGSGLVHEDCITKMRLMSLIDLGSNESGQIPYALIKDTLRVNLLSYLFTRFAA